jgi:hypothetical protein
VRTQDVLPGMCCCHPICQLMLMLIWLTHCWQAAIGVDLEPWKEGVKEEHIEQLYCGLGEASLRIQVWLPPGLRWPLHECVQW